MKQRFLAALVVCLIGTSVTAAPQFRLATNASMSFAEVPSLAEVRADPTSLFYGLHTEILTGGMLGFGVNTAVRFSTLETTGTWGTHMDWWTDWDGDLFLSFHPFRGGSLLDPFLEVGYGVLGRAQMTREVSGKWEDGGGLWHYVWDEYPYEGLTNFSFYPYAAAGLALDMEGFLVGVRLAARPFAHPIPGTQIPNYPLKAVQIGLFAGVALGGHGRR